MHQIHVEIGAPKVIVNQQGNEFHVIYTVKPLPSGYGPTIGNALRRALLSSLPGVAVTGVKIKGAAHEYTALAGVKDTVLDILLNLKQLRMRKHTPDPIFLTLKVKKEGVVTAADIKTDSDVEIINKDLYITTLDAPNVELDMQIRVEKGVGYKSIADLKKENVDPELILVDASFSPILKVAYTVSDDRVGQRTDLDSVDVEILTDGSITADDSLRFAANLLNSYFTLFNVDGVMVESDFVANIDEILVKEREEKEKELEKSRETYTPIEILNLSPRSLNALINGGIGSIEQLTKCTESKLANLRGFGKKAMNEVREALKQKGMTLFGDE